MGAVESSSITLETDELVSFFKKFTVLSVEDAPTVYPKKLKVDTHHLVFFDKGTIVTFDGKDHYREEGDTTDRKLPKEIAKLCPIWFKEINS